MQDDEEDYDDDDDDDGEGNDDDHKDIYMMIHPGINTYAYILCPYIHI